MKTIYDYEYQVHGFGAGLEIVLDTGDPGQAMFLTRADLIDMLVAVEGGDPLAGEGRKGG